MEDIIIEQETGTEAVSALTAVAECGGPSAVEQNLAGKIKELWDEHSNAQTLVKTTKEEMKDVRQWLSESLHLMKELLVTPGCTGGRNGRWASFLRSQKIATATADRLVRVYRNSMDPQPNLVTEEVAEAVESSVEKLFSSLLPRLRKNLTTSQAAHEFVLLIVQTFELPFQTQDNGILVLDPEIETLKEPSSGTERGSAGQCVPVDDVSSGAVV